MKEIKFSNKVIKDQIEECREDELTDAEIVQLLGALGIRPEQIVSLLHDRPGVKIVTDYANKHKSEQI